MDESSVEEEGVYDINLKTVLKTNENERLES